MIYKFTIFYTIISIKLQLFDKTHRKNNQHQGSGDNRSPNDQGLASLNNRVIGLFTGDLHGYWVKIHPFCHRVTQSPVKSPGMSGDRANFTWLVTVRLFIFE